MSMSAPNAGRCTSQSPKAPRRHRVPPGQLGSAAPPPRPGRAPRLQGRHITEERARSRGTSKRITSKRITAAVLYFAWAPSAFGRGTGGGHRPSPARRPFRSGALAAAVAAVAPYAIAIPRRLGGGGGGAGAVRLGLPCRSDAKYAIGALLEYQVRTPCVRPCHVTASIRTQLRTGQALHVTHVRVVLIPWGV